jgi:hypothetical protein
MRLATKVWYGSNERAFVVVFGRLELETPRITMLARTASAMLNQESASYAALRS